MTHNAVVAAEEDNAGIVRFSFKPKAEDVAGVNA